MKNKPIKFVTDFIIKERAVPVFYHQDWEVCETILKICYESGFKVFEFTNRGSNAAKLFKQLKSFIAKEMPDMLLGAGTIFNVEEAKLFAEMDTDFIVSPILNPEVGEFCKQEGLLWIPGCMSTTEIFQANRLGAQIIKLFPGNILGPAFLKSIRPVFPSVNFMPTGGVTSDENNLKEWFSAGVIAVGMGSNLFPKDAIANKEWGKIQQLCKNTIETLHKIR